MDKAMQLALERCPKSDDVVVEARRAIKREIFCQGYAAAENALALTVEDVLLLMHIWTELPDLQFKTLEAIAEETLKRFNEQRKK